MDRGESVIRIKHLPVTGRKLTHERHRDVADYSVPRHRSRILKTEEPISLRIVGVAVEQRGDESGDQIRVHLAVAVELDDDVGIGLQRREIASLHRPTDAFVALADDHSDARVVVLLFDIGTGSVGATIIDAKDPGDAGGHA